MLPVGLAFVTYHNPWWFIKVIDSLFFYSIGLLLAHFTCWVGLLYPFGSVWLYVVLIWDQRCHHTLAHFTCWVGLLYPFGSVLIICGYNLGPEVPPYLLTRKPSDVDGVVTSYSYLKEKADSLFSRVSILVTDAFKIWSCQPCLCLMLEAQWAWAH